MCGRFANQMRALDAWRDILQGWPTADAQTGYNIAPQTKIPIITRHGAGLAHWGLIPSWSKDLTAKFATFNARLESVADKPSFTSAWRRSQACLVPALGYYEWRQENAHKQPYFIRTISGAPLVFAGLYEPARNNIPASCSLITTTADPAMAQLHPRIPLMASLDNAVDWLAGDIQQAMGMRRPNLQVYAVSTQVNNARHSGEALIGPV